MYRSCQFSGVQETGVSIQEGNPPRCLMDFWAQRCLEEMKEAEEQQVQAHKHTSNQAMADTVMDFLFASQDATTAAVVWVTVLMAEYPDVLQKVRAPERSFLSVWDALTLQSGFVFVTCPVML